MIWVPFLGMAVTCAGCAIGTWYLFRTGDPAAAICTMFIGLIILWCVVTYGSAM